MRGAVGSHTAHARQRVGEDLGRRLVDTDLVGEGPGVEQVEHPAAIEVSLQGGGGRHADIAHDAEPQAGVLQNAQAARDAVGEVERGLVTGASERLHEGLADAGRHVEAERLDDVLGRLNGPVLLVGGPGLEVLLP